MKKIIFPLLFLFQLSASAQTEQFAEKGRKWFMPDHLKMEFAGNIGFISGGPGYISRNKTLETDVLFGFLPKKYGGDALITLTSKVTYSPWRIPLKNTYHIVPLSVGFYLSHTFGPQFDSQWPEYYPQGYYWWATAVRPGAYIGGKAGRKISINNKKRDFEAYYELGTYDLILISYVQNTGFLKPSDIVNLAFGIKLGF
jgi:hypothetical protein